jgi:hypothetical protein
MYNKYSRLTEIHRQHSGTGLTGFSTRTTQTGLAGFQTSLTDLICPAGSLPHKALFSPQAGTVQIMALPLGSGLPDSGTP